MEFYYNKDELEVGIDEVGRGCLAGPVYACAVILPKEINDDYYTEIKDSKKLTHKKRLKIAEYIKNIAIDYSFGIVDAYEIDSINILQASFKAMHKALDGLIKAPEHIIVDGKWFKPYINKEGDFVPHKCFVNGDNRYLSIAAASILAKVERDNYMSQLCEDEPYLKEYGWEKNKAYYFYVRIKYNKSRNIT